MNEGSTPSSAIAFVIQLAECLPFKEKVTGSNPVKRKMRFLLILLGMIMVINVTAEDISNGIPGSACYCPIALAIKRIKPSYYNATVGEMTILAGSNFFFMPSDAMNFIKRFDSALKVEPFSFEVN